MDSMFFSRLVLSDIFGGQNHKSNSMTEGTSANTAVNGDDVALPTLNRLVLMRLPNEASRAPANAVVDPRGFNAT